MSNSRYLADYKEETHGRIIFFAKSDLSPKFNSAGVERVRNILLKSGHNVVVDIDSGTLQRYSYMFLAIFEDKKNRKLQKLSDGTIDYKHYENIGLGRGQQTELRNANATLTNTRVFKKLTQTNIDRLKPKVDWRTTPENSIKKEKKGIDDALKKLKNQIGTYNKTNVDAPLPFPTVTDNCFIIPEKLIACKDLKIKPATDNLLQTLKRASANVCRQLHRPSANFYRLTLAEYLAKHREKCKKESITTSILAQWASLIQHPDIVKKQLPDSRKFKEGRALVVDTLAKERVDQFRSSLKTKEELACLDDEIIQAQRHLVGCYIDEEVRVFSSFFKAADEIGVPIEIVYPGFGLLAELLVAANEELFTNGKNPLRLIDCSNELEGLPAAALPSQSASDTKEEPKESTLTTTHAKGKLGKSPNLRLFLPSPLFSSDSSTQHPPCAHKQKSPSLPSIYGRGVQQKK